MTISIGSEIVAAPLGSAPPPSFISYGSGPAAQISISALVARGLTREVQVDRQGRLYASDAGLCERKAVLGSTVEGPQLDTAASRGYYALGNTIEDLVMDGLYESNALLFKQYRLPDVGLNLGGYIDGIIVLANHVRVMEVKSCGKLPDFPKPNHAAQAYIYSAVTGLPASLLYFSRTVAKLDGSMMMKEFNLEEHPDEKRKSVYRAVLASLAVLAKRVPDRPGHMSSEALCSNAFCPFTGFCWHGSPVPNAWEKVSPAEALQLATLAQQKTDELLAPAAIADRRVGVLKHLQQHGNSRAKELLTGSDWSTLV